MLEGVREHITSALANRADVTESDVRAVLAELGPPSSVAEEAYATRPVSAPQKAPWASRTWVPPVVAIALGATLLFATIAVSGLAGYSSSEACTGDGGCTQGAIAFNGVFGPALVSLVAVSWLWLPTSALIAASTLWTRLEKLALVLLVPGLLVAFAVLVELGWLLTHTEVGINLGSWAGLALITIGGGLAIWRLTRTAGHDRARSTHTQ